MRPAPHCLLTAGAALVIAACALSRCSAAQAGKTPAAEQSRQVVAAAVVAPLERWNGDLAALGEPLSAALAKAILQRTGVEQLQGIDRARPGAIVVQTDGIGLFPVAVVPVDDPQTLLASLAPLIGAAQAVDKLPSGQVAQLWKIGTGAWTLYVRHRGDWLFAAQSLQLLEDGLLPDLDDLLARPGEQADFSLHIWWQHMPEALRTWVIDNVHTRMRLARLDASGRVVPRHDVRLFRPWLSQRLMQDLDRVSFSWTLTAEGTAQLDLECTVRADSLLGQFSLALAQPLKAAALPLPKLAGPPVVEASLRLPPLATAWHKLLQSARGEIAAILHAHAATLPDSILPAATGLWPQGEAQAVLAMAGHRPPSQAVVAARGWNLPAFQQGLAQLLQAALHLQGDVPEGDVPEGQPLGEPLAIPQAWWLHRALAAPADAEDGGTPKLRIIQHGRAYYALLSHDTAGLTEAVQEAAPPAVSQPSEASDPLMMVTVRVGAALRLASMVSEDWDAKALFGKISLVVPPDKDRLRFTAAAKDHTLRLRLEADSGLVQAASLGLTLWLLAN